MSKRYTGFLARFMRKGKESAGGTLLIGRNAAQIRELTRREDRVLLVEEARRTKRLTHRRRSHSTSL